jgi:hypothetical protein
MTNNELEVALQEAMAVVAIAINIINDAEDRLGVRQMWSDKANKLLREYFNHVRFNDAAEETRHQDWIGD